MRNPNQLKVDIDRLRYSADMAELRKWLCKILKNLTDGSGNEELTIDNELDTTSTNPVQNAVIAAAIQELQTRTQYFKGAVTNLDTLNSVSSLGAYEYIGSGWKGFVVVNFDAQSNVSQTALSSSTPSYNGNTLTWISGQPSVIRRSYVNGSWTHWEEVGIKPDAALSTTSENSVQNKAITAVLNRLQEEIDSIETPTMREFDIDDETGCLMLTEVGRDDGTSFEIDEYGNFNVVVDE